MPQPLEFPYPIPSPLKQPGNDQGAAAPAEKTALQVIQQAFQLAAEGGLEINLLLTVVEKLAAAGNIPLVLGLYRTWLAHTTSPYAPVVWFNLGTELTKAGETGEVETAYRNALKLNPAFYLAAFALGQELERQGRVEDALAEWWRIAPLIDTATPDGKSLAITVFNNLGRLSHDHRKLADAERALALSLALDPDQPIVSGTQVLLRQYMCQWPIEAASAGLPPGTLAKVVTALASLSATDDPAIQLAAARRFLQHPLHLISSAPPLSERRDYGHDKIRIGYLSSDFRWHAVSLLTAELLELHDRSRVEVFGFCWTPPEDSVMRTRMITAMDRHIQIGHLNDEAAARCIRSFDIDVLVDLHGLATHARPNIMMHRPAPVQVTYLGYPGSTGHPEIDYVLADDYLVPDESLPWFTETPIRLPTVFQVSDRKRQTGERPSRQSCGLPEEGFVFCSFSNTHKITPEVFTAWMAILRRTPGSVLWLLADNEWAQANMLRHAREQGVDPARLIFTGRVTPHEYLARYQAADLFLDTFPFNAGTTANDALWMGLPILTLSGQSFASRMAGSLLLAAGLPELITTDLTSYENKAVALGNDREKAVQLRTFLEESRATSPLFDMPRIVRDIENAFIKRVCALGTAGRP